ncbi:MAG TPA: bifunctional oligoribonuclease/PAP phosphatase NrnA [Chthonomonadales bacterium]|nr:bifunctional oligoribonuclease/PAP phosphatase NrnA [Chthonomonadales bacterium]
MKETLRRTVDAIQAARSVVVAGHVSPDGDTIGCTLALVHACRQLGKDAVGLSHHGVPVIYRWMPGQDALQPSTPRRDFDLGIIVDTGSVDRVGDGPRHAIESARQTLCIDHHATEGRFGDIRLVDPQAAATGELVYRLVRALPVRVDKDIADCLMCAIITDTGSFRFINVTPGTFRTSAALMRCGARPAAISELVFENRSFASLKLLGRTLDLLQVGYGGAVAWSVLGADVFRSLGATDEDTEGIVNHVRALRGTQVGLFFREVPGEQVRISLRSREGYDVQRVAAAFGGGGHTLAAGCSVDPPLDTAIQRVLAEVSRWLG